MEIYLFGILKLNISTGQKQPNIEFSALENRGVSNLVQLLF